MTHTKWVVGLKAVIITLHLFSNKDIYLKTNIHTHSHEHEHNNI
jgi:hypothetical protein